MCTLCFPVHFQEETVWRQSPHWPCHSLLRPGRGPRSPEGRLTSAGLSYGVMWVEAPKGSCPGSLLPAGVHAMASPCPPCSASLPRRLQRTALEANVASVGLSKESTAASLSGGEQAASYSLAVQKHGGYRYPLSSSPLVCTGFDFKLQGGRVLIVL